MKSLIFWAEILPIKESTILDFFIQSRQVQKIQVLRSIATIFIAQK